MNEQSLPYIQKNLSCKQFNDVQLDVIENDLTEPFLPNHKKALSKNLTFTAHLSFFKPKPNNSNSRNTSSTPGLFWLFIWPLLKNWLFYS